MVVKHFPLSLLQLAGTESSEFEALRKGLVLLSQAPYVPVAVVFVHGWGGAARSTWEQFPQVLEDMTGSHGVDAFFLDYRSRGDAALWSASVLQMFIADLVRDPVSAFVNPSLPTGAPLRARKSYEHILIVAHSLGAVITRRALLDLRDPLRPSGAVTDDQLSRVRLLFFAPAHSGADVAALIGSGLGLDALPGAKLVGEAALLFMPSLRDLQPGSQTLNDLRDNTRSALAEAPTKTRYLRAAVLHAERDRVVRLARFEGDPPHTPVPQRNHRSICKPDRNYKIPGRALQAQLQSMQPASTKE
jgi:pimeloyl-ACP methyl ester carboxylesterase